MSLQALAQDLAKRGRFGDDALLHVSKAELAGLASLAPGGKLAVNPETGLPEAFFFLPFLSGLMGAAAPAAAAAAPAVAGMGAAAAPAIGAAAAPAAGALGAGLTAGMEAASGLGALGSAAAPAAAGTAASTALPAAVSATPAATGALGAGATGAGSVALPAAAEASKAGGLAGLLGGAGKGGLDLMQLAPLAMMMPRGGGGGGGKEEDWGDPPEGYGGGDAVFPDSGHRGGIDPEWDYFPRMRGGGLVKNYNYGGMIKPNRRYQTGGMVAPIQPQLPMQPGQPQGPMPEPGMMGPQMGGGLASLMEPPMMQMPQVPSSQTGSPYTGNSPEGEQGDEELIAQTVEAIKGNHPNPDEVLMAFVKTFGEEALQDLIARLQQTEGNAGGDGTSDSVPALINGQEPAALSDGEYVMPADVVSDLGNGSTDAGAATLDDMADRVRQFRHGGAVQPPSINPRKVMPV